MANAVMMPGLTPNASRLLAYFVARRNSALMCRPTVDEIGKALGVVRRVVFKALKELASGDPFISVKRNVRRSSDYTVLAHAALSVPLPWHTAARDAPEPELAPSESVPETVTGVFWPDFDDLPPQPEMGAQNDTSDEILQPVMGAQSATSEPAEAALAADSRVHEVPLESTYVDYSRESRSDSDSVPREAARTEPNPDFVPKPSYAPSDPRFVAFLLAHPGWVLTPDGSGYVPAPKVSLVQPGSNVHPMEARYGGSPDPETGHAVIDERWDMNWIEQQALSRAGIECCRSARETLGGWLREGIEAMTILNGIDWFMQNRHRKGEKLYTLKPFDKAVRVQHDIAQRRNGRAG